MADPKVPLFLLPEQAKKFLDALGDESDWPKATDDPLVNWAVDMYYADEEDQYPFDLELYQRDIEAMKTMPPEEK